MTRNLISTVIAAALALTSFTATPAQALDNNLERFLVGAGALLIIGSILNDQQRNDKVVIHRRAPPPRVHPLPHPPRHVNVLPRNCLRTINTSGGNWKFMNRRCISRHAPKIALPQTCLRSIKGRHNNYTGYGAVCLRNQGYVF